MKKNTLILFVAAVALGFSLIACSNWNNPVTDSIETDLDLFYKIDNRWSTMTKEEVNNVKILNDILIDEKYKMRNSFKNVTISVLHNDKDVRDIKITEMGQSEVLNDAQLKLIQSCKYSTNLRITSLSQIIDPITGLNRQDSLVRYLTIAPEKEAEYEGGFETLVKYLKESSTEHTGILERDKLQPGKFFFTVTKAGSISNIKVVATSGYPLIDDKLVSILENMPENWKPAENGDGVKVDQELVFSFGSEGC